MADPRSGKSGPVSWIVVASLLGVALLITAPLWWLGDWENHGWALTLTLQIVWGCWLVGTLAALLTRVTIFGWYFRRYFLWDEEKELPPEVPRLPPPPWPKSPAASFSITVVLVSLTGAAVVASVVLWILRDALGEWLWTILQIIWACWWVAVIAVVLTRISIFGVQKQRAIEKQQPPSDNGVSGPPAEGAPPAVPPDRPEQSA
jgi:hypothetical protein